MSKYTYDMRLGIPNTEALPAKRIQEFGDYPDYCKEFIFKWFTKGGKVRLFPDVDPESLPYCAYERVPDHVETVIG